jgi:predicted CoA-binding protein
MKDQEIKEVLRSSKTVAVIGISPKEDRPSYGVASYLKSKGYRIIPVRPDGDKILGEKVYHSLTEIPREIEIDRGAKVIWMQEGIINQEACTKAEKAGLKVVMDRCTKKEHQRLF